MTRIFPLRIVSQQPANLGSADCHLIGEGDDGIDYAIKRVSDGARIPASEFICNSLAQACGIAVPTFEIAILPDIEKVFASRWEDGSFPSARVSALLMGTEQLNGLSEALSAVFAFDLFVYNIDRHFGNYMFRHKRGPGSLPVLLAPDYSRAFLYHGCPPPPPPLPSDCNTSKRFIEWQRRHRFSRNAATELLDRLDTISDSDFGKIISQIPSEWLSSADGNTLVTWWKEDHRDRIFMIKKGLPP